MRNAISKIISKENLSSASTRAAWGAQRAIFGVVGSFFGAQLIAGMLLGAFIIFQGWTAQQADDWFTSIVGQFIALFITSILSLGILFPFIVQYTKQQIIQGLGLHKPQLKVLGYAIIGVIIYFGIYIAIATIAQSFTPIDVEQEQDIGFDNASAHSWALVLTFVSLVVFPPIVEEIIFRGFLYGGLRKHLTVVGSSLLTALIFSLPHATQSVDGSILWIAAIDTFILSLVLTYLREKTHSIYAGMIVHAVKNGVAFLLVFILNK